MTDHGSHLRTPWHTQQEHKENMKFSVPIAHEQLLVGRVPVPPLANALVERGQARGMPTPVTPDELAIS